MTLVAVMTQPMRVAHCAAFLRTNAPDGSVFLLVADPGALSSVEIPGGTTVLAIEPGPEILSKREFMTSKARRRLLSFARGGTAFGVRFERMARHLMWRLRYVDRLAIVWRSTRTGKAEETDMRSRVLEQLEAIHRTSPISSLVAFDVFDLPPMMEFSRRYDIRVIVR